MSEGRSEEETTSGDGSRVPIPGSGSGSFKADSGEFQAVVIPYGTSQAGIKKEGGEREVGLFIPGMEGTLTVLDETGEEVDSEPLQLNRGEFYRSANGVSLPREGHLHAQSQDATTRVPAAQSGRREGRVRTEPIVVEFENVTINTEGE